jgi:hypothetical protein
MKRFFSLFSVGLMLVAVSALAIPAGASAEERGYHLRGIAALDFASGNVVGVGHAAHLGNYTEVGHVTFLGEGRLEGWAILTNQYGDQLSETFTGQVNVDGTISGTVTFTGGTGRFEFASGSGSLAAEFQPDGTLLVVVVGTIDY